MITKKDTNNFKTFLEEVFSVKNENNMKIVRIFGIKMKFSKERFKKANAKAITHFSAFTYCNAGDNLLVKSLKKSIEKVFDEKIQWNDESVHKVLNSNKVNTINKTRGIMVGGGGLFLKDTNTNKISGWQWPCSIKMINKIKKPLYLIAVGYNRFRGQDEFEPYFEKNIKAVVKKASFIGLRNHGSIEAMKKYLPENLHKKLVFHPCATTILSKLYNLAEKPGTSFIALNCAFDRSDKRYGDNEAKILTSVAKAIKKLSEKHLIRYYVHVRSDVEFLKYLNEQEVKYQVEYLNKELSEEKFIELYTKPELVIGMRGHAQMIPFGCKTPILSIISHDKMQWFLDDINHPEWGVDVKDENIEQKLYEKAEYILKNKELIIEQIEEAQEQLWEITKNNILKIHKEIWK